MLIILMKFLFFITQRLVSSEALSNTHEPAGQFILNLSTLEDVLPLAVFFILAIGILLYFFSDKKEDQHNDAVYQKDLNRYRALHYCERCDIIYDQEKRYHPATANGFENAMKYY